MKSMREFGRLDDDSIRREVIGSGRPAVLRGLVDGWPAVRKGRESAAALAAYLRGFDNGAPVDAIMTPPDAGARIFYDGSMEGFNFLRNRLPLSSIAEQVLRYSTFERAPAVAAQSAPVADCVPGFERDNRLTLLDESIAPRIWLGSPITTPTHLDEWCNIACVVAGRRRFTLFPPDQIGNLYVGPLDFAPTGAPMSLVQLDAPDLVRYPRFRDALATAETADLGPADAIYIPPLWWHHVRSLDAFNLLVNYWWHADAVPQGRGLSGFDCMVHCLLGIRDLPPETRNAWAALFDHYVFGPAERVTGHIPEARHGILGRVSRERRATLCADIARRLDGAGNRE
jgi:hypothetical protein